ncbi:MAG TPA: hypothetical protein VM308_03885 [Sphingomicrobium sp.]|nr:hypothetical protein [Sphingomicrobium sp.]
MIAGTFWSLGPLLLGMLAVQAGFGGQSVTRLVVQDEVILRVPVQPGPMAPGIEWVEHKGPKCVPAALIRRAMLSGSDQVDFILADRSRVRAKFAEDCPALDFYRGFYLQPGDDRVCAGRDAIFSRIGGSCTIRRFRHLEPTPQR